MDSEQLIGLLLFSVFAVVAAYVFAALVLYAKPHSRERLMAEKPRPLGNVHGNAPRFVAPMECRGHRFQIVGPFPE